MTTFNRLACGALLAVSACETTTPDRARDRATLLRHHATILAAHRAGIVDAWLDLEADTIVVGRGGRVKLQDRRGRREGRTAYLAATRFDRYEDVREPRVEVSADGSLGWVIAEVAVEGMQSTDNHEDSVPVRVAYSWVELYRRTPDGWRMVGNVSNERSLD